MNTRAMLMGLCLVLLDAAAHAGEIPANTKGIWFCQTVSQTPTATVYVSDVFAGDFVGTEVRTAFGKMLAEKHNVTNGVSCSTAYSGPGIEEKLAGDHQRWFQQIRAAGGSVVETHWVFAPGSERLAYLCTSVAQHMNGAQRVTTYFYADPIEMPGSEQGNLGTAWAAYLDAQHPGWYMPAKGCLLLPADPAKRQNAIASMAEPWQAQKAEMVRVNWTYAPVQKSAADDVPSVFCQALRTDNKHLYVTAVFPMADVAQANAAVNAWRTYLHGIKDPDGMVVGDSYLSGCDGPGPAKGLTHQRNARVEQIRDSGFRVVETNWLPANTDANPKAAQATLAAAGAATQTYQCYQAAFGANYMTPVFTSAKDLQTLNADWRAHILQVHPANGVVQTACAVTTPAMAASNQSRGYTPYDWKE